MRKIYIYFFLLVLFGCVDKIAPTTGAIHGIVKNGETSVPLGGCSVMLMPTGVTAVTGNDGSFHFEDLAPNTYSIEVNCYGYYNNKKSVIVSANEASLSVDILLIKYDPNNRLPELGRVSINEVTYRSVRVGGEIVDQGSSSVTERGFLYSELPDVTIATATKKVVQSTDNMFFTSITNLKEKTDYYIVSYAINACGTAYSDVSKFKTGDASSITPPTNVIYVSVAGSDINDGSTWGKAKRTIKAAYDIAASGKQIWVSSGVFNETVRIKSGIPIYGGFKDTESTIETRTDRTRITCLRSNTYNIQKTLVSRFQIVDYSAYEASVILLSGNVTLENCYIGDGKNYVTMIMDCFGENNELKDCSIEFCSAKDFHNAILSIRGNLTMVNCFFRGNYGNILNDNGNLSLYNCVVSNNQYEGIETKCASTGKTSNFYNCTFANNGGDIISGYGGVNLYNCLIWNNSLANKKAVQNSCFIVEVADNAGVKFKRPSSGRGANVSDWQNADWALQAGSVCINKGISLYFPYDEIPTDIAGNERIVGSSIDIGAYEW